MEVRDEAADDAGIALDRGADVGGDHRLRHRGVAQVSALDLCGVLVLAYATCVSVWTLCLDLQPLPIVAERERPSALPLERV